MWEEPDRYRASGQRVTRAAGTCALALQVNVEQRAALGGLWDQGKLDEEAARRLERELNLEEQQLSG
jgi:hypothetical protein